MRSCSRRLLQNVQVSAIAGGGTEAPFHIKVTNREGSTFHLHLDHTCPEREYRASEGKRLFGRGDE